MIYLDNAATSFPKPRTVYEALCEGARVYGGNPGRGGHRLASASAEAVYNARESIARLFHFDRPDRVIFTHNATEALNTAIKGLAPPRSNILISDIEHNSVRRAALAAEKKGCTCSVYKTCGDKDMTLRSLSRSISPDTRVIVACHRSNICGRELPINEIGKLCRKRGISFIIDASQSAGGCDIDFIKTGANILCAPGHKGLLGIMGSGFMLISPKLDPADFDTLFEGGSGVDSRSDDMPPVFPERLEAGTLPVPAICALAAGVGYIESVGINEIEEHENYLRNRAAERLGNINKVELYLPEEAGGSILLFNIKGVDPERTAALLDSPFGICSRAGLHCSPLAHESIGTPPEGAVRISFGPFNTTSDVTALINGVNSIAK